MNSEDSVVRAIRALAEHDRELEAPVEIEARLLRVFRRKRTQRRTFSRLGWFVAVAAALIVVFLAGVRQGTKSPQYVQPAQGVAIRPPQLAVTVPPSPEPASADLVVPAKPRRTPLVQPPASPGNSQPREIVTEFFPLMDGAAPFERGELLRVTVPVSTMRRVGLPVNENRLGDRVYADVLVGQEGLARAIRFVSYEQ